MTKTSLLILLAIGVCFAACKKDSPQPKVYYYDAYEIGVKYPASGSPADSIAYSDSIQVTFASFQGDTIKRTPDDRFYLSGSYYKKRYQNFEVYRYTK